MMFPPTGTCFDDSLDFLEQLARECGMFAAFVASPETAALHPTFARMRVVHAICVAPTGKHFAHAWVEQDGSSVWQGGVANGRRVFWRMPLADFEAELPTVEATRYTVAEALRLNAEHDHYGPWEARYRALAGRR